MIVSYKHNYIFVKTTKTAGTSMEIALSTHTGDDDVVTHIAADDELTRLENPNARLPQNFCNEEDKALEYAYRGVLNSRNPSYIDYMQKEIAPKRIFKNHIPIDKIKEKLDPAFFADAFKFTIQRHPYDRLISTAYWQVRDKPHRPINVAIRKILEAKTLNNTHFYMIAGKQAVDYFILYEKFREGIEDVGKKIGAPDLWSQMPQTKHKHRTDRRPAKEVLTQEQRETIFEQCKDEFKIFGYEA
jgi:hypothetical protein